MTEDNDWKTERHYGTPQGAQLPVDNKDMEWVEVNRNELSARYAGQWIAVLNCEVVAHGVGIPLHAPYDSYVENMPVRLDYWRLASFNALDSYHGTTIKFSVPAAELLALTTPPETSAAVTEAARALCKALTQHVEDRGPKSLSKSARGWLAELQQVLGGEDA